LTFLLQLNITLSASSCFCGILDALSIGLKQSHTKKISFWLAAYTQTISVQLDIFIKQDLHSVFWVCSNVSIRCATFKSFIICF